MSDVNVLAALNGFDSAQSMRAGGKLLVPGPSGRSVTLDLDASYRDRATLSAAYWHVHPRYLFVKNTARAAKMLDLGAGSGGMIGWKAWGEPERPDLAFYAVDLEKGEQFDHYVDYDIVEIGPDETKFPDESFDAIVCSHVIHYVHDLDAFAWEASRITRPGGKIYVEWPNAAAPALTRKAFEPFGIECGPLGIEDDLRQVVSIESEELRGLLGRAGCRMLSGGAIENDFLFPELFRYGVVEGDAEMTTYGLWLMLRFANYAIFEKMPKP